jgi:hypothetical protein
MSADNDNMILLAAVGFAAFLMMKKNGTTAKGKTVKGPALSFDTPLAFKPGALILSGDSDDDDGGYDPRNPGKFVPVADLTGGDEWQYSPSRFDQNVDDLLAGQTFKKTGYW